jgi:hypothetical protein
MKQPPLNQRKECTARKLDRKAALEQHARGLSITEIGRIQGVNPSTVWRFLDRSAPHRQALETFKTGRGNEFATLQAKSMALQHKILDTFNDGIVAAMTTHQKTGLVSVLSAQTGTLYDKERLECGKSTQNVGVVARIMGEALEKVYAQSGDEGDHEPSLS